MHLGFTVLTEEQVKSAKKKLRPKERPGEKYEVSRWTPLLQDVAEVGLNPLSHHITQVITVCVCAQYAAADALDDSYCPWLRGKPRPSSSVGMGAAVTSAVTGGGSGGEFPPCSYRMFLGHMLFCRSRCNWD